MKIGNNVQPWGKKMSMYYYVERRPPLARSKYRIAAADIRLMIGENILAPTNQASIPSFIQYGTCILAPWVYLKKKLKQKKRRKEEKDKRAPGRSVGRSQASSWQQQYNFVSCTYYSEIDSRACFKFMQTFYVPTY